MHQTKLDRLSRDVDFDRKTPLRNLANRLALGAEDDVAFVQGAIGSPASFIKLTTPVLNSAQSLGSGTSRTATLDLSRPVEGSKGGARLFIAISKHLPEGACHLVSQLQGGFRHIPPKHSVSIPLGRGGVCCPYDRDIVGRRYALIYC